ncbi:Protein of unknown function DUF2219 [Desulfovibrio sp. X2]|uniref:lipid A deacylase LpxR family protein n=1 Tax=Desulfovibrio sp. X2 TaxID=941449 RepID=UPI0003589704|nr:lipid A deacylase LpxR family protein [Desulfovibrio sp. X2]EPR42540.1 Protein of unknown function DUF2219 [Desulfovibrio sp. X2]
MLRHFHPLLLGAALCALLACLAPAAPARAGTLMAQWENDIFAGTDRHYTNGAKLLWLSDDLKSYKDDERLPMGFREWLAGLPYINQSDKKFNVGLAIGQDMFTPSNISDPNPPEGDHPYAGWLYGSLILDQKDATWLDTVELTVGMVGPSSQAEQTQKFVHHVVDSPQPQGWDTQLHDEPGLMLTYVGTWRALDIPLFSLFGADVIPHFGATLGNVKTYANTGAEVRLGWNLPKNFGTTLIGPGGGVNADTAAGNDIPPFSLYGFAYTDGRAVARDIFLDGNTFQSSRHVSKKTFVGDLAVGVGLGVYDFFASFCYVFRSPEYTGDDGQQFGSINVGYHF